MSLILRLSLSVTLAVCLSSCQLIGALINTALKIAPMALLAENDSAQENATDDIQARARQINVAPVYDGRIDWINKGRTAPQGLASR